MKNCINCKVQLISLGFNYYNHPVLRDHHGRTKVIEYQCLDAGKNMKIM